MNNDLDRQAWLLSQNALIEAGISEREVMKTANTEAKIKHKPQVYLADDFKKNEDKFLDIAEKLLKNILQAHKNDNCANKDDLRTKFLITITTNEYQSELDILNNKKLIIESLKVLDQNAIFSINHLPKDCFYMTTYLSEENLKRIRGLMTLKWVPQ